MKCTLEPGNNEGNKITITIICDKQGPGQVYLPLGLLLFLAFRDSERGSRYKKLMITSKAR